mgnify:CR=1 FL=1
MFGVPRRRVKMHLSASAARVGLTRGVPLGVSSRRSRGYIVLRHRPGGTWGRARRLAAVTGGPGAAFVAGVAVGGLGWSGGVGYCGRLGTLRNGSRSRAAVGAAAGGGAKRSIRAWSGAGPGSG